MLTFETDADGVLEVNFDAAGRDELVAIIQRVRPGDHEHVATPAWGGDSLTETFLNPDLTPIHQITFQWIDSDRSGLP